MKKIKYTHINTIEIDLCLTKDAYVNAAGTMARFRGANNWGKDKASFIDVVLFANDGAALPEVVKNLKQADRVIVKGKYRQVSTERDGRTYHSQEIVASEVRINEPVEYDAPDEDVDDMPLDDEAGRDVDF